jgi:hypothetical protein
MRRRRGNSSTPLRLVLSCLRRKRREEGEEEETIGASNVSSWEIDLSYRTEQNTSEQWIQNKAQIILVPECMQILLIMMM